MPDAAPIDLRVVRAQREQALWRVKLASRTAWISAVWAIVVVGLLAIDTHEWALFWLVGVGAATTAWLGWGLWAHQSREAAWLLGVLAAGNLVFRVIYTGTASGIVLGLLVFFVYFRGWQGAETLHELAQAEAIEQKSPSLPPAR